MLIRRRVEKLERFTPPTLERLLERVERDAWRGLSREEQKLLAAADSPPAVRERYQGMISAALTDIEDTDLDRMILYYQPNASRAACRP